MGQYLKISYPTEGSYNYALKKAMIFIGEHYCKLTSIEAGFKENKKRRRYEKKGKDYVTKECGRFCGTAIKKMVKPKKIEGSPNAEWSYHKRIFGLAYGKIIDLLLECPHDGYEQEVKKLIQGLYNEVCKNAEVAKIVEHRCSDALIFCQKLALKFCKNDPKRPKDDKNDAKKILSDVAIADRHGARII